MRSGQSFSDELARLAEDGLSRRLSPLPGAGGKLTIEGRAVLNFSSNDYLDLANDARLKEAAKQIHLGSWASPTKASAEIGTRGVAIYQAQIHPTRGECLHEP